MTRAVIERHLRKGLRFFDERLQHARNFRRRGGIRGQRGKHAQIRPPLLKPLVDGAVLGLGDGLHVQEDLVLNGLARGDIALIAREEHGNEGDEEEPAQQAAANFTEKFHAGIAKFAELDVD